MADVPTYPGVRDFLVVDGLRPAYAGKLLSSWFLNRVNDALSQVAHAPPEHRAGMYEEARAAVVGLHNSELTAIAALDFMTRHYPPTTPEEQYDASDPLTRKRKPAGDHPPLAPEPPAVDKPGHGHAQPDGPHKGKAS